MKRELLWMLLLAVTAWMGCKKDQVTCGTHQHYDDATKVCTCNADYVGANCDSFLFENYPGTYTGDLAIDSVHSTTTYIIGYDSVAGTRLTNYHNMVLSRYTNNYFDSTSNNVDLIGISDEDTAYVGRCYLSTNLDTMHIEFTSNYHDTLIHNYVFKGLRQ